MLVTKRVLCLLFLAFEFSQAGVGYSKCAISDGECQRTAFAAGLRAHAKTGVPELGIPAIKPYEIKDSTVSILGLMDLIMVDGQVDGLPECEFTKYETDIEEGYTVVESFCESIVIHGHYKVVAGPLISTITSNGVSGDGNGKIQIDKLILKMEIPFNVEKYDDDEIYLVPKTSEADYTTEVTDKITFEADNVMIGSQEVSKALTDFMNKNWKMIYRSFGKYVTDKVMLEYYESLKKFFSAVPAKEYITDDLSRYVKS